MAETLFPGFGPPPVPDEPTLSRDARRTLRQATAVKRGVHPLALVFGPSIRMHPDASRDASRDDPPNLPLRCGSCLWRLSQHGRGFPKCLWPDGKARISHSAATDVRAWWPACEQYMPGDNRMSPDAARWIPHHNNPMEER